MPGRKSESSETKSDSRRSSLRRLSSIASLHTLNPFNRRRSNNATDTPPASSSSNLSVASSAVTNASMTHTRFSPSQIFAEHDNIEAVPPPPQLAQYPTRRGSYICLPDDPIGGMPRSRTFSNLPLPSRGKKTSNPLVQSKSHARLPSNALSSSRLPSPRVSTRKHSGSHLSHIDNNAAFSRRQLNRSDTEPLLPAIFDQGSSIHRSTAFKENLSPSPAKEVPGLDLLDDDFFSSSPPSQTCATSHRSAVSRDVSQTAQRSSHAPSRSNVSLSKFVEANDRVYRRLDQRFDMQKKFQSSPSYHSFRDRPPTPGQAVQRWSSQPLLGAVANNPRTSHGEIKQTRLMSARQAPTPPPAKTPLSLSSEELNLVKLKSNTPGHLRHESEQTPAPSVAESSGRARAQTVKTGAGAVHTAQPVSFWTGRFSSLNDRYRNEELMQSINFGTPGSPSTDWKSKNETDMMHSTEANNLRMRRAVEQLHVDCATEDARQSFLRWQKQLAAALNLPELAKPVGGRSCALAMSLKADDGASNSPGSGVISLSSGRKISFMDRLLGKKSKLLGAAA